ncbi:hypothetical protein TNCV_4932981 [Trichonephila clavipes]|nr:hypothetical protein TNCV_4932981 [Trichonephila clavipes]
MGLQFLFMDENAPCHRTVADEQLLESEDIEQQYQGIGVLSRWDSINGLVASLCAACTVVDTALLRRLTLKIRNVLKELNRSLGFVLLTTKFRCVATAVSVVCKQEIEEDEEEEEEEEEKKEIKEHIEESVDKVFLLNKCGDIA